jgi:Heterodisulfide reductase, subunit A and related polyferredoxins
MSRIGVFICHCGINIAATVDVERVAEEAGRMPGVAFATHYKYMCSDPGQNLIQRAIAEHNWTASSSRPVRRRCTSGPSARPSPRPG